MILLEDHHIEEFIQVFQKVHGKLLNKESATVLANRTIRFIETVYSREMELSEDVVDE